MCISTEHPLIGANVGSERQLCGYAKALAQRDHTVYLVNALKDAPDWDIDYDVCHIHNAGGLKGPNMLTAQLARELGIPVLMSPVYWPTTEVQAEIMATGLADNVDQLRLQFNEHLEGVAKMLTFADWLLPNGEMEMEKVVELLGGEILGLNIDEEITDKDVAGYTVIHNGIDLKDEIELALSDTEMKFSDDFEELLHDRFILCVARVEPRKNQINLIKAIDILCEDDPDLQTVIMGARAKQYVDYIKDEECGRNVLYCPPGPKGAVLKMMRRCQVHAMPSYIETPGLVNLEAAALNCPIVVARRGSVEEYFGDVPGVFYCNPTNEEDIAEKIRAALDFGPAYELGSFVRNTYSYEQIAYKLEMVYKQVIDRKKNL